MMPLAMVQPLPLAAPHPKLQRNKWVASSHLVKRSSSLSLAVLFSGMMFKCNLLASVLVRAENCPQEFGSMHNMDMEMLGPLQFDGNQPPTTVWAPGRRIVAVGDLHGDLEQTKRALRLAGVLSSDGHDSWIGGSTVLVQVGDILDRGDDEIAIMSLLQHLSMQANLKGGAVFQVNGNHETMNVDEDFRYVSPGGFEEAACFVEYCEEMHSGNYESAFSAWHASSRDWKHDKAGNSQGWLPVLGVLKMHKGISARTFLFSPGGPLAKELSKHGVVIKVNNWLFAHGGILPHHVDYGLERINHQVSKWMRGEGNSSRMPFIATRGYDSVVWSRLYSNEHLDRPDELIKVCSVLELTLNAAAAKGLIVGHTPQTMGVNCECKGKIWRIDVGMSSGVLQADPQVLEIVGDRAHILSENITIWNSGALK